MTRALGMQRSLRHLLQYVLREFGARLPRQLPSPHARKTGPPLALSHRGPGGGQFASAPKAALSDTLACHIHQLRRGIAALPSPTLVASCLREPKGTGMADINIEKDYEVRHWMRVLACSELQLREAVRAVGIDEDEIRRHLRENVPSTSRWSSLEERSKQGGPK